MDWLTAKIGAYAGKEALIYGDEHYSYSWLSKSILRFENLLNSYDQTVFSIHSDYNPYAIAMFLALTKKRMMVVPMITSVEEELRDRLSTAQVEISIRFESSEPTFEIVSERQSINPLFNKILEDDHAGLVLFSSGSTGKPKAMVHDLNNLIDVYRNKKPRNLTILVFLMFDHIGGLNTLLNALSMGATIVIPECREPDHIAGLIAKYRVNLLPTSPTFLNLLLMSESYKKHDLSSLRIITYGTECMPSSLLGRLREVFPKTRLLQTFGTSETGIATTLSRSSESSYMKIEDPNVQWKVVKGELWLKGKVQILGYLNYQSPFTEDGWFPTGDLVEVIPEGYIKIIGRKKEVINVGGQKVLPLEVEDVIMELREVKDVEVYGEANPVVGEIVVAEVVVDGDIDRDTLAKKIKLYCREKLERYKSPVRIKTVDGLDHGTRFKRRRRTSDHGRKGTRP